MKKIILIVFIIFNFSCLGQQDSRRVQISSSSTNATTVKDSNYNNKDNSYYIIILEIKQSTFTLDLGEHIKNKMNSMTLSIAVDKRLYDSVVIGQVLSSSFKRGSLLFNGDFSKLKVTVVGKKIVK